MQASAPLAGREALVVQVAEAVRATRVTVLTGPPGVGKTRIANAAFERLETDGRKPARIYGTAAGRDVPLSAFSSLLDGSWTSATDGFGLARAREAVGAALELAGTTALLVDDAHLLDGLSALVLRQLVEADRVAVLLVAPDQFDLTAALGSLVRDESRFLYLEPLDEAGTTALLEELLAGQVSVRTGARLHALSGGIPLLLFDLANAVRQSGALSEHRGVWRLDGPLPADDRLAQQAGLRLSDLDATSREILELVAMSEPLELEILCTLENASVIEGLERARLLRIVGPLGHQQVTLAHPLYTAWLRSALTATGRRRLAARLVAGYEGNSYEGNGHEGDDTSAADPVRLALLRVEAGLPTDPAVLFQAGTTAIGQDWQLAYTLLRAAVDADAGPPALMALADLVAVSRPDEAATLVARVLREPLDDATRIGAIALSAFINTFASALPEGTASALPDGTASPLPEGLPGADDALQAPPPVRLAVAAARLFSGDANAAIELAAPMAAETSWPTVVRWRAMLCAVPAMATAGELDDAIALGTVARTELALEPGGPGTYDASSVLAAEILAHERRGDLETAHTLASRALAAATDDAEERSRPRLLQCMARVALLRGQPTIAAHQLRDVLADLRGADEVFAGWNLSLLAAAEAMRGHADAAWAALREMDAAPHRLRVFGPEQELMRAEACAYSADLAGARTHARRAAEAAHALGQRPVAVLAWNAVARYGDPQAAVTGVGDVSFDGPVSALLRGQIAALATSDHRALHEIAEGYAALSLRPLAADAFATLTHLAAGSGDVRLEARAAQRLAMILDEVEPLSLPATRMPRSAHALTTRERDVAALAAAGLPDIAIAEQLGLSVRTVQTHLAHVYAKTNTAGRRELAALMNAPTRPTTPH